MLESYNGWTCSPNPDEINIHRYLIPKSEGVTLTMRQGVAVILANVASDFNKNVSKLKEPLLDDWGFAYRTVRGANVMSNHASGTAIDLNATNFPMGTRRMTRRQRRACRAIVAKYRVITWGGEWTTRPDEMHFEISRGVTLEDIREISKKLGLFQPLITD